jgi:hypothetical protein
LVQKLHKSEFQWCCCGLSNQKNHDKTQLLEGLRRRQAKNAFQDKGSTAGAAECFPWVKEPARTTINHTMQSKKVQKSINPNSEWIADQPASSIHQALSLQQINSETCVHMLTQTFETSGMQCTQSTLGTHRTKPILDMGSNWQLKRCSEATARITQDLATA